MKRYTPKEVVEDFKHLSIKEILLKYYDVHIVFSDSFNWQYTWSNWNSKYVELAYKKIHSEEFFKNFRHEENSLFNFEEMEKTYNSVKRYSYLDEDLKRFLGFMAGTGFFKNITIHHWLKSHNWQSRKEVNAKFRKSILEIAKMQNGQNYIKSSLVLHDWWKSFT